MLGLAMGGSVDERRCFIQIVERRDGVRDAHTGRYVLHYNPTIHAADGGYDGGLLITTSDPRYAKVYDSIGTAFQAWKQPSGCECHGTQEDGKPNRPLTAYTVSIVPVEAARSVAYVPVSPGDWEEPAPAPEPVAEPVAEPGPVGVLTGLPTGMACTYCREPIYLTELAPNRGALLHHECLFRSVIGSIAHQEQRCHCFVPGSTEDDPPGLSLREGARAAVLYYREHALHHGGAESDLPEPYWLKVN